METGAGFQKPTQDFKIQRGILKTGAGFRNPGQVCKFIEDPIAYARPWTVTEDFRLDADGDLLEYVCNENERDLRHIAPSIR